MSFEEFKNSMLYAKLPTRWPVEAAVAALTFGIIAAAFLLLDVSERTVVVLGSIASAWFGIRIAVVAVRSRGGQGPPMGPGRLD